MENSNDFSTYLNTFNHQIDITCFGETWLNNNNTDIVFPNYSQVHKYRENKKGVSIPINELLHYHELEELSIISEIL